MKRTLCSSTFTVAMMLVAAGCGGLAEQQGAVPEGDGVARSEMAEIEAAISAQVYEQCDKPNLIPILDCVEKLPDGKYRAHFGYDNKNNKKVDVDIGKLNRFVPKPEDRGQPEEFKKGLHHEVFTVKFDGKPISWILTKNSVIASKTSPACGPPPPMCPPSCDDGNPCTADKCDASTQNKCVHTPVMDGMSCGDGNVCNGAEMCRAGVCLAGTNLDCNDNNVCTTDSCDKSAGCKHAPVADGTSCPATGACNTAGMCQAGQCQPGPGKDCDDHNPCTADSCAADGTCTHTPVANGTSCSDGNACNGAETCQAGSCAGGTPLVCNDNNACTDDTCAPTSGCVYTPVTDGKSCDNPNGCGAAGICKSGMCTPGNGPSCDDGNPCTADACEANGTCSHTPVANGTSCSDLNACNGAEVCQQGACTPGTPVTCTAVDACHTAGTCDPASGQCSKPPAPNGTPCSDGNSCTDNDACQSGACTPGTPKACTAADACHSAGTCDPTNGTCSNPPVTDGTSCSDGNSCNGSETCKTGQCTPGTPLSCDDHNPCTAEACDPTTGCSSTPVADGTVCAPANGCQSASTCHAGVCQPGAGTSCDDNNPCTADACAPDGSCLHTPVANGTSCGDGNACNGNETCQAGTCAPGTAVVCTASDQCHVPGTCNPATGQCSNPAASDGTGCTDGNLCTQNDACKAGACVGGSQVTCSASDQCHVAGTCDATTGQCSNPAAPDGSSCSDGNGCTTADSCKAGACTGGAPVTCTASDQCHAVGTCDPASGQCSNPPVADGTTCNDSNNCTSSDACSGGVCKGGNPLVCTASDQCHVAGTCDAVSGKCSNPNAADGTTCTDSNGCTVGDICTGGACVSGGPLVCTADPGCTPGTCNPTTGVCSAEVCGPTCATQQWAKAYATPLLGNVTVDATGAAYVTGGLAGSIDFGGGPVTSNGSSDVYLAKINPATGAAVWAKNFGDDVDQAGVNLTADKLGHLAVIGTYIGSLRFNGTAPALSSSTDSIFLAGLDAATGNGLWAKNIDLGGGALLGIATDPTDNNVVVTGFTGAGAAANFGGGALTSGGGKDVVVAKLNSATGALIWARQIGGTGDQLSNAVAVDATGRIFLTGQYSGVIDFGAGALPTASSASKRIFVARLDGVAGGGQASKAFGTSGQQVSVAIGVDSSGNVVVGGAITGATVDFGTGALASAGAQDAFVAKLTPDLGGVWAKRFGDATTQKTQGLAVDSSGNVVAVGLFQGVLDLSPAATLTSAGGFDAFVVTIDGATGAYKCAAGAGDGSDQAASGVGVDATGGQFVLGSFISSISWDGATALTGSPDTSQTFVVKRK